MDEMRILLCDTYQMDAWFPFGWKWKKELEKSSYSVWAIDELKRYIVGRLYGRCTKPTVTMPRSGSRSHRGCSKRNLKTIFMIFRNALIWMMELGLEAITSGSGQKNLKRRL